MKNVVMMLPFWLRVVLGGGLAFGLVLFGLNELTRYECRVKAEKMQLPWSYGLIQGCMVTPPSGQVVPLRNFVVSE